MAKLESQRKQVIILQAERAQAEKHQLEHAVGQNAEEAENAGKQRKAALQLLETAEMARFRLVAAAKDLEEAARCMELVAEIYKMQLDAGMYFVHENPLTAAGLPLEVVVHEMQLRIQVALASGEERRTARDQAILHGQRHSRGQRANGSIHR